MPSKTLAQKPLETTSAPHSLSDGDVMGIASPDGPTLPEEVTAMGGDPKWLLFTTRTDYAHLIVNQDGSLELGYDYAINPNASGELDYWWAGEGILKGKVFIIGIKGPFDSAYFSLSPEQKMGVVKSTQLLQQLHPIPTQSISERGGIGYISSLGVYDPLIQVLLDISLLLPALGLQEEVVVPEPVAESIIPEGESHV